MYVKICGLTREEDIDACVALSVDAIGLNLVPSSPRFCSETRALALAQYLGDRAQLVWVVGTAPPNFIIASNGLIQRCDRAWPWPDAVAPDRRVEVVRSAADTFGSLAIVDAVGGLGGTGKRADWGFAHALTQQTRVVLAGGLTPNNVQEAISTVRPFGVDVASGVEATPGMKDHTLLRHFVGAARSQ
jgi:phosphoribosylanthranilate isomerase